MFQSINTLLDHGTSEVDPVSLLHTLGGLSSFLPLHSSPLRILATFSGLYILVRSVIYSAMLLSHLVTYNEITFYTHIYRIAI